MENLGSRIRELREDKRWTQPYLAELLGVSKSVISFWENDVNEPKASYLAKMAEVFGVSAGYLLGLEQR